MFTALALAAVMVSDPEIEGIVSQMTQDEKLEMIGGGGFNIKPTPRLGLAGPGFADGPVGVRNFGPSTAYPAGVALAATFNDSLAHQFGRAMARDAKARGTQIVLGPGVNLSRIPQNGRNFEYLGEDALLCSNLAVQAIKGMQQEGVAACVKHFAANEHESDRNWDSSEVDERVLRELYFRPFEAAVKEGDVATVMCSYNLLNGTYTSANRWLLTDVLRREWGFRGFTMTDWGAAHETPGVFASGMDIEMPTGEHMSPAKIRPLLAEGKLSAAELNEKVRRMLGVMKRFGWLRKLPPASGPLDSDENHATALQIAREGTVLLKNDGALPVSTSVRRILVVGDQSHPATTGGGGSSEVRPIRTVSLLEGIRAEFAGKADVQWVNLSDELATAFVETNWDRAGYQVEMFAGTALTGDPIWRGKVAHLVNDWTLVDPRGQKPTDDYSLRITGLFTAPSGGAFDLVHLNDDGLRVWLDGRLVVDDWRDQWAQVKASAVTLEAGRTYSLKVEYYQTFGEAVCKLGFLPRDLGPRETEFARELGRADLVVVTTGFLATKEGEGYDRPYELPDRQRLRLDRVAASGKPFVIVNFSGAAVDLHRWVNPASAIIQAWYPGGIGAKAIAEILSGTTNPSGKLACTFPAAYSDHYASGSYPPSGRKIKYTEGLLLGYRWFDAKDLTPEYAFGHGLSYTSFCYSNLRLHKAGVGFTLTNTGKVAGTEVAQLYVSRPGGPERRSLHSYARVSLAPGKRRRLTLPLRDSWMSRWDTKQSRWVLDKGSYGVWVGASSRDLPLRGKVRR